MSVGHFMLDVMKRNLDWMTNIIVSANVSSSASSDDDADDVGGGGGGMNGLFRNSVQYKQGDVRGSILGCMNSIRQNSGIQPLIWDSILGQSALVFPQA